MKKRIIAILLLIMVCFTTILSPLSVHADDYVNDGSDDDGSTYYIVEGREVDDLFNFVILDAFTKPWEIIQWVFTFKTFVVLKEYDYEGTTYIKGYWNTPNLQMLARNLITSEISDGYTDETYDVNETQWLVKVGDQAAKENAITKYGFTLPNYEYHGEFPKEYMSVHNILPTSWWDAIVRFFKSLFGLSFINPPDASNFKTITYWNHEYTDKEEYLIQFFQKYYYKGFYDILENSSITDGTFTNKTYTTKDGTTYKDKGAQKFLDTYTTEEIVNSAYKSFQDTEVTVDEVSQRQFLENLLLYVYNNRKGSQADLWNSIKSKLGISDDSSFRNLEQLTGTKILWFYTAEAKPISGSTDTYSGDNAYKIVDVMKRIVDELNGEEYNKYDAYTGNIDGFGDAFFARAWYYLDALDGTGTETNPKFKRNDDGSIPLNFSSKYNGTSATADYSTEKVKVGQEDVPDGKGGTKKVDKYEWFYKFSGDVLFSKLYTDGGRVRQSAKNKIAAKGYDEIIEVPKILDWTDEEVTAFFENLEPIITAYNKYEEQKANWESFKAMFEKGSESDKKHIHYNQCLVDNEGEDKECWSTAHSIQKTSICVGSLYTSSGMWKAVDMSKYSSSNNELSHEDAVRLIQSVQSYCGPYYSMVMSNLLIVMENCAKANNYNMEMDQYTDVRVMPYDTHTMINADRKNFTIDDPRVEIYRDTLVGSLVADLSLQLKLKATPQKSFLNLAGKITELSVVFQQFINFDLLDSYGLSPTNLWTNAFVLLFICAIVALFMFKTVKAIFAYVHTGAGNVGRIVSMFLILVIEVGMFSAIMLAPDRVWNTTKNVSSKIMNLGESTFADDTTIAYLFGEGDNYDPATLYYLPYLDAWSVYNTGYGLFDKEQLIENANDKPETLGLSRGTDFDYEANWPKIGSEHIKHWSVLLLDSFEYNGTSHSIHSVEKNGVLVNGKIINNNAYRVVDHFLAPRITITGSGTKSITVERNENYNGQFQSGFLDLLPKLMGVVLMLIISFIKLMTFIWFWYMLYTFIFQALLSKVLGKSWKEILLQTFSPLLYLVFIGLYAGLVVKVNGLTSGIMAILIQVFMYILTVALIRFWSKTKYFPQTVKPIAMLCNMSETTKRWKSRGDDIDAMNNARESGVELTEETIADPDKYREALFNEDGSMRADIMHRANADRLYTAWAKHTENRIKLGQTPSTKDVEALRNYMKHSGKEYDINTFAHTDEKGEPKAGGTGKKTGGKVTAEADDTEQQQMKNKKITKEGSDDETKK